MKELTPELIKNLTPEQLELLVELGDLAKKESELNQQIETTRRQEEKVGLTRDSHSSKSMHDDAEFVDLLSLRLVRERTIIRDKIAGILKALIEAGLGDLGIIRRQAINYGIKS